MRPLIGLLVLAALAATPRADLDGKWKIDLQGRGENVRLTLERSWNRPGSSGRWSWVNDYPRRWLRGLPEESVRGPVSIALERDAGVFHLEGRFDGRHGSGRFTFEGNPEFAAELERQGLGSASDEDLMRLCADGIDRAWIREARSLGLRSASLEILIRMHDNGLTPEFVRALAPHFDAEELIRLHDNGVSADYVREFRALGYESASAADLIRLKNNDVTPAFARRAQSLHGRVTPDDLIKLRVNGVD